MSEVFEHAFTAMGTVVTFRIVGHGADRAARERTAIVARAADWFRHVNDECTRFDSRSELMRLSSSVGVAVPVSALLFEAVHFALAVAEESNGAFDPTVGGAMAERGYNREYRTGDVVRGDARVRSAGVDTATFRDVQLDADARTITLGRPLVLDLGAVAKGLAIDLAARELRSYENFVIDAGGDLYFAGHNAAGDAWSVGIRHPRDAREVVRTLRVSDVAVCTSGDYERGAHILDPRCDAPAATVASATAIAPSAMVADALATAAFVLGPIDGIAFLERQGVDGILLTPEMEQHTTSGMRREN